MVDAVPIAGDLRNISLRLCCNITMETIRITTDTSRHAGCGGLLGMSEEAPIYIVEHEGLETRLPGVEMVCLTCGERIRSQDEVEA